MVSVTRLLRNSRCNTEYSLMIFTHLFLISGIISFYVGITVHSAFRKYQHFLDNNFLSVSNLFIIIGATIFCIAIFGCYSAAKEKYWMILAFASLLVLVFILELAGGISGYVLRNEAQEVVREKMLETMPKYQNGSEIYNMWDQLQADFHCCGTNNALDWVDYLKTEGRVPMSCCLPKNGIIGEAICTTNSSNLYHSGCLTKFVGFTEDYAIQLARTGLGIAFVQVVGVGFVIYLAKAIETPYAII